jgi:hypothetical protein
MDTLSLSTDIMQSTGDADPQVHHPPSNIFHPEEPFGVHSEAALEAYRCYPKLYKELRYQRAFVS